MENFWIQVIGLVGMVIALLSFQQKTQKGITLFQTASTALFTLHFGLLGLMSGCLLNGISMVRAIIYAQRDKKWAAHVVWPIIFTVATIVCYALNFLYFGVAPTPENLLLEVLPAAGTILTNFALRLKEAAAVRRWCSFNSPLWIIYNAVGGSMGGVLTEAFNLLSIFVGMLRLDRKKAK